jgi:hypothetical protein
MSTFLGASPFLDSSDIDAELIASAQMTYLEGYLFDRPEAKAAFFASADIAHSAGRKVALTLSDTFCVERHHAEFTRLIAEIDILFANEGEARALTGEAAFEASVAARSSQPMGRSTRSPPPRSQKSSTPPGPAISTRPACCTASRPAATFRPRAGSARSPRPRRSAMSVPGRNAR